jgi:hypothetical protein
VTRKPGHWARSSSNIRAVVGRGEKRAVGKRKGASLGASQHVIDATSYLLALNPDPSSTTGEMTDPSPLGRDMW